MGETKSGVDLQFNNDCIIISNHKGTEPFPMKQFVSEMEKLGVTVTGSQSTCTLIC